MLTDHGHGEGRRSLQGGQMSKRFSGEIRFAQPPDVVFAAQADPAYVTWKHEHMAAFDISAEGGQEDGRTRISSTRKLPAKIPSAAKRFVGESITISETHTWGAAAADGSRRGEVVASFGGAPMAVKGTLELRPEGDGTVIRIVIDSSASVPLVGGKLEALVGEQFMLALHKEQEIAPQWFAREAQ
jgi:hypothetical protein